MPARPLRGLIFNCLLSATYGIFTKKSDNQILKVLIELNNAIEFKMTLVFADQPIHLRPW